MKNFNIDTAEIASEIFDNLVNVNDNEYCPLYGFEFGDNKTLVIDSEDGSWQLAGDNDKYRNDTDIDIDLFEALEIANDNTEHFVDALARQLDLIISNL